MSYRQRIEKETLETLAEMLKASIRQNPEIATFLSLAVETEAATKPHTDPHEGGTEKVYTLSSASYALLDALAVSIDRDMMLVTEKVLKSLKYAVITAHWQDL